MTGHKHYFGAGSALRFLAAFAIASTMVSACSPDDPEENNNGNQEVVEDPTQNGGSGSGSGEGGGTGTSGTNTGGGSSSGGSASTDGNDENDILDEKEFTTTITITWNGSSATVDGAKGIIESSVSGGYVVLGDATTDVSGLKIVLKGSSTDGSFKYYNQHRTLLSFNGLTLTSKKGAAINLQNKKSNFVLLSGNSSLTDASTYSDANSSEDCKGCFFSEGQVLVYGSDDSGSGSDGTLNLKGNFKHGIVSDDYIRQFSGSIVVSSAISDGLHVGDYFRMDGGSINVKSDGDAIDAENGFINIVGGEITVNTSKQTAHGIKALGNISVSDGSITATLSGAGSKAIKSDANITISGGKLNLTTSGSAFYDSSESDTCSPCCIKSDKEVNITGGDITVKSTGKGGKGINCATFTMDDGNLDATTTGSQYSYSNRLTCKPKAVKATDAMTINGGNINIQTSGTEAEGLECKKDIIINDGHIAVKAYDDCINSAGVYSQRGGYVYCYSTNNDGVDSNYGKTGAIYISGGVLIAHSASSPEEAIDADNHGYLVFKGGTIFTSGGQQGGGGGFGGGSSNPTVGQPTLFIQGNSVSTGYFTVKDSDGKVVMSCYIPRSQSQSYSFVTSPSFENGKKYEYGISSSAPSNPATSWDKYYYDGGTVSATLSGSYTAGSGLTTVGTASGGGGWGGGGGPGGGGRW